MNSIKYRNKYLYFDNASVEKIAKNNKTPFYLYSLEQLKNNFGYFRSTFSKNDPLICFAIKSNPNLVILKNLQTLGAGADVVSLGELQLALKAGIEPKKIVFSGVGKTAEELDYAISKKILLINAESENEVGEIKKIAQRRKTKVVIGLRLNPNISARTIKKISTGKKSDKFGIDIEKCFDIFKENKDNKFLVFVRTKVRAERVKSAMERLEIDSVTIHGDKEQSEREIALLAFRTNACKVMIATDVSARGIDIDGIDFVINYDIPEVAENYVHRVGRTGRGRAKGRAISFCAKEEKPLVDAIEEYTTVPITRATVTKAEYNETIEFADDTKDNWKSLMNGEENKVKPKKKKRK